MYVFGGTEPRVSLPNSLTPVYRIVGELFKSENLPLVDMREWCLKSPLTGGQGKVLRCNRSTLRKIIALVTVEGNFKTKINKDGTVPGRS